MSDAIKIRIDSTAPQNGENKDGKRILVHPLGAIVFLVAPFHVIVEDETSDGCFLLWMARFLGRDEIIRAYNAGRFVFRHAGGKGQFLKAAKSLSHGAWGREGRLLLAMKYRCAAIMDGDEKYAGHGANVERMTAVQEHVAFTWLLAGRTIENYVPEKYLRRRLSEDGIGDLASKFFQLTPDQRNYFAVKSGYRNQDSTPQTLAEFNADPARPSDERALFGSVDAAIWASIATGFGERLASVFSEPRLRCSPKERVGLTASQTAELEGVLTDLVRHL